MHADGVVLPENAAGLGPATTITDIRFASCSWYEVVEDPKLKVWFDYNVS